MCRSTEGPSARTIFLTCVRTPTFESCVSAWAMIDIMTTCLSEHSTPRIPPDRGPSEHPTSRHSSTVCLWINKKQKYPLRPVTPTEEIGRRAPADFKQGELATKKVVRHGIGSRQGALGPPLAMCKQPLRCGGGMESRVTAD